MLTGCWMVNINNIMFLFLQASRKLSCRARLSWIVRRTMSERV